MDPWLEALRARLPGHAALLDVLLAVCQEDDRIRVLELQCSIARGVGDGPDGRLAQRAPP